MDVVEVIWDDAHCTTGETSAKKAAKIKGIRTHTVGYLMSENDFGVVIATDTYEKEKHFGKMINFVPWGMIVEYYRWEDVA